MENAASEAAGVLLNTVVEDTHLEYNPEVSPDTVADAKPVLLDDGTDGEEYPDIIPENARQSERPRTMQGKPLPDLRHEQTYLAAIARTDGSYWSIARVTLIDFLLWPTATQFAYVFVLDGFKFLRTGSTRSGRRFGELIRDFLNIGGVLD